MKKKKRLTLAGKEAWTGRLFVLPWVIGVIAFFLVPLVQSLLFSFQSVELQPGQIITKNVGFKNIAYIFTQDPDFLPKLTGSLAQILYQVPVVVISSLLLALLINQKFKGRTFVRAVVFLPFIMATGVVMQMLKQDVFASSLQMGQSPNSYMMQSAGLGEVLRGLSWSDSIVEALTDISSTIFDMLWLTGLQVILFLAGLQTISPSLYEAASIEGATAWEELWKITIPMLSPIILVNIIYTLIDTFTNADNAMMQLISENSKQLRFSTAAAMSWVYFLVIFIVLGAAALILKKKIVYVVD